jgi:hypothetical protein
MPATAEKEGMSSSVGMPANWVKATTAGKQSTSRKKTTTGLQGRQQQQRPCNSRVDSITKTSQRQHTSETAARRLQQQQRLFNEVVVYCNSLNSN